MTYSEWLEKTLNPLLSSDPAPSGAPVVILSADTDRTQSYVFESDKLPEIRGASRQLNELNAEKTVAIFQEEGLPPECVLYAQGGGVLALLPDEEIAAKLKDRIERAYPEETGAATITAVFHTLSDRQLLCGPNPESGGHFGDVMKLMALRLRRAKDARGYAPFFERMPFARTCASCQKRPASGHAHGDSGQPICAICASKLEKGGPLERSYWVDRLDDALKAEGYPMTGSYPRDIAEITGGMDVAFVYADGDGIGRKLQALPTPRTYRTFSQGLVRITRESVAVALAEAGLVPVDREDEDGKRRTVYPWEIITIGGDDVLILLPASAALRFSDALARRFQEAGKGLAQEVLGELSGEHKAAFEAEIAERPIAMSVGFAIGKPKTPVRLLRDGADRALHNAKRRAHDEGLPCIDFHNFVKEGMMGGDLKSWRGEVLTRQGILSLTARPYTLPEVARLSESVGVLRSAGFPRSRLYNICSQLERGQLGGRLFYYYQRARLPSTYRRVLEALEGQWNGANWPWIEREQGDAVFCTVLPDILELL